MGSREGGGDPLEVTIRDPDHSDEELRFLSVGRSEADRLLVVSSCPTPNAARESGSSAHGRRLPGKDEIMGQNAASDQHNLRDEYDFSGGVRGKHHEAYCSGTNVGTRRVEWVTDRVRRCGRR